MTIVEQHFLWQYIFCGKYSWTGTEPVDTGIPLKEKKKKRNLFNAQCNLGFQEDSPSISLFSSVWNPSMSQLTETTPEMTLSHSCPKSRHEYKQVDRAESTKCGQALSRS